jgi:hypothetical protein
MENSPAKSSFHEFLPIRVKELLNQEKPFNSRGAMRVPIPKLA